MVKRISDIDFIELIDGTEVELRPLKIKYMIDFMEAFDLIKFTTNDEQSISVLSECATICMRQNYPTISTREQLEDNVDLPTIYKILDVCAGIKINPDKDNIDEQAKKEKEDSSSWDDLDLASLEAEAFLIGSWKNFEELELSITMKELVLIIEKMRDLDYNEKKFLAAIQGVDLDKESGKSNAWEDLKARVYSGGQARDGNDVLALQGQNAIKAGFGIGMGLSYERIERTPKE